MSRDRPADHVLWRHRAQSWFLRSPRKRRANKAQAEAFEHDLHLGGKYRYDIGAKCACLLCRDDLKRGRIRTGIGYAQPVRGLPRKPITAVRQELPRPRRIHVRRSSIVLCVARNLGLPRWLRVIYGIRPSLGRPPADC